MQERVGEITDELVGIAALETQSDIDSALNGMKARYLQQHDFVLMLLPERLDLGITGGKVNPETFLLQIAIKSFRNAWTIAGKKNEGQGRR
jgi:hypothetical protein